jgi:hypothetical protein
MPAEQPPISTASELDLIGASKAFIVWLASAVAGISAILYAAGYLVTRGQNNLLGLQGFVDFSHDQFLQEGGKFLAAVGYDLGISAQIALVFGLAGLAVAVVLAWGTRRAWPGLWARWSTQAALLRRSRSLRSVLVVLLLAGLIWLSGPLFQGSVAPLCITDLLYAPPGNIGCGDPMHSNALQWRDALLAGKRETLATAFEETLYNSVGALVLCGLALAVTKGLRWRRWIVAPFVVAATSAVLVLPLDYGALMHSLRYPRLQITLREPMAELDQGPLFLFSKTESSLVIWCASCRHLIWIPLTAVRQADVIAIESLFGTEPPAPALKGRPP